MVIESRGTCLGVSKKLICVTTLPLNTSSREFKVCYKQQGIVLIKQKQLVFAYMAKQSVEEVYYV